jgi:hypothetical protein
MWTMLRLTALAAVLSSFTTLLAQPATVSTPPASDFRGVTAEVAPLPEAPLPALAPGPASTSAKPCHTSRRNGSPEADSGDHDREPCLGTLNPYKRFLDTTALVPLTPSQKARLALHNVADPGDLATITGLAGITVGANSHTAYGPGWSGFGKDVGYSFLQDATDEFFGTFLIPSLTRQDPQYHHIPDASVSRRILHALARTVIAQHDDGRLMPNYASLLTYPICTQISNLYVPGINGNGPSTTARIITGYGTGAAGNLITEFLPDVARHVHVRVIFVQRILNQVSSDQNALQ